jgi:4-hydroxybenzoyl-CoA thioesterase
LVVRFGDIDQAGIVYYPRLVNYFHVAMEEFFAGALELNYPRFLAEHQLGLPATHPGAASDDRLGPRDNRNTRKGGSQSFVEC